MWQRFGFGRRQHYELERLIDSRQRFNGRERTDEQIICDIDKTYLETEFDSWLQIARTALQDPEDKVTVAAASEVLMMMRWGGPPPKRREDTQIAAKEDQPLDPRPLHFVSSSPPQMRSKLEDKMLLDGIDWSSDTFKNQAYNLLAGRVDLLRQHVAYKSAAILRVMGCGDSQSRFHLIGDSAESDAYTYLGVHLFTSGILSLAGYQRFLVAAGVDEGVAKNLLKGYDSSSERENLGKVASIAIRQIPRLPLVECEGLTDYIDRFTSFPELGILFLSRGFIEPRFLATWLLQFNNRHRLSAEKLLVLIRAFHQTGNANSGVDAELGLAFAKAEERLLPLVYAEDGSRQMNTLDIDKEISDVVSRQRRHSPLLEAGHLSQLGEDGILDCCRSWLEKSQEARRHTLARN